MSAPYLRGSRKSLLLPPQYSLPSSPTGEGQEASRYSGGKASRLAMEEVDGEWVHVGEGGDSLKIQFDGPAKHWTDAAPIGNGRLGAMIWGGVASDQIQLNGIYSRANSLFLSFADIHTLATFTPQSKHLLLLTA